MTHGISFPAKADGNRSTTTVARTLVADALRPVDPIGAKAAEQETNWRSNYLIHFRRLIEAGLVSPEAWNQIAEAGLESARAAMVVADDGDGADQPLESLLTAPAQRVFGTAEVQGTHPAETELWVPYRGNHLSGDTLRKQLDEWVASGIMEPSVIDAVNEVMAHPEWLSLEGRTAVVLGAGAEMGPLRALLRWGATVAAVDLPRKDLWGRVAQMAEDGAGRLLVPTVGRGELVDTAGADLLAEVPDVADWIAGLDGQLVVGNYLYADGATHVRVSVAADVLAERVCQQRTDTGLAFLATPTDVFAVPREAVEQSAQAYADRTKVGKLAGRPLRWVSRGKLLHKAYPVDADPGINDSLVPVQGPNYALAKRIQRWRASAARASGREVSFHVAPSTRTKSVVKNPALAAAFAGAHRFNVEAFEPETSNTLMAALLVRDLMGEAKQHDHPWQDEAYAAAHGGLWRTAYAPRSALGLAAVLGYAGRGG